MKIKKFTEEVFYTCEKITTIDFETIRFLKNKATRNIRKRSRLCCHMDIEDSLHEMLIVHASDVYVRPHKHKNKIESFHIIEGDLDVIIFDEKGDIHKIITMGTSNSGKVFYYRLSDFFFHTVVPVSDNVVFHEITNGPFDRNDTIFAPWSPDETDFGQQAIFLENLKHSIANWKGAFNVAN